MQKINRDNGGSILLWIVAIALLIFTAARSVHLVTATLPADMAVLGFAALFGLDIGLLAWLFWTTRSARGGAQRTIGALMVVVDLAGITASVIGDTLLVTAGQEYAGTVQTVAVWIVPIVILSNVIAIVAAHLFDPAQAIRDAQRALDDELQYQLAESLRQNASQVASGAVPAAAAHKQAEIVASFLSHVNQPATNGNGHKPEVSAMHSDGAPRPKARGRDK